MENFSYIYDEQGNKIEITDKNFMSFEGLPTLRPKMLFQNIKLCEENHSDYADHNAAMYFLYLYVVQNLIIYIWEEEGIDSEEILMKYRKIFKEILPRILYISKNPIYKNNNKIPLANINEFKKLPERIHFLFFLSLQEITVKCNAYTTDSSILLNQYKKLHKYSCHEYGGATDSLLGIFDKYSCSKETKMTNSFFKEFWDIH